MISRTKGRRGEAEQAPADFFASTRDLLVRAREERHEPSLRRGAIRLGSHTFSTLSAEQQSEIRSLYTDAYLTVTGAGAA